MNRASDNAIASSWDALFHIDRVQHEALFARFAKLLLPGGRLMLNFGGSDQPA